MGKGLMIMLVVFLIIAIIGWVLNVFSKVPEEKKKKYRKYLLVFYGIFLIMQGAVAIYDQAQFKWLAFLQLVLGIVLIGAVTLRKQELKF